MKKNLFVWIVGIAIVGLLGFKMMSSGGGDSQSTRPTTKATTSISVVGSDTMVELVGRWAEAYMKKNPSVAISVNGGGSGPGIRALIDGTTDICSASRPMKDEEIAQAKAKGFTPVEHTVALDGIAVIVNPGNKLDVLTIEQLKKLYTAVYTDWKQVGGSAQPVDLLSRENSSGTYQFFQEHVLNKEDYAAKAKMIPATATIVKTVEADAGSIGYVGLGYAKSAKGEVKILNVKKDAASPAVAPSDDTVRDKSYPIARSLFFYTHNEATGAAKDFVDFCTSAEGQKIVEDAGFVQVK